MIYPMFVLVLLTFIIAFIALHARIDSVRLRQIEFGFFRLMLTDNNQKVPERVTITTRAFNNMFEIPILFHVGAVMSLALDQVTNFSLMVAWLFVLSRISHSWIHLTYNNVIHRMYAFWAGMVLVLVLWLEQLFLSL